MITASFMSAGSFASARVFAFAGPSTHTDFWASTNVPALTNPSAPASFILFLLLLYLSYQIWLSRFLLRYQLQLLITQLPKYIL